MDLQKNIKYLRELEELSLAQVAEGIGSSKSYIWELENKGICNPSIDTVIKLAQFFRISIDELVGITALREHTAKSNAQFLRRLANQIEKELT